jgi:iron complex outermembrane receptor protein
MTKTSMFTGGVCAAAIIASWTPALAQAQTAPDTGPTPQEATSQLDEVVVTAQKRTENVQTVPIAIVALSAARLESAGVSDIGQLQQLVPGLKANTTVMGAQPFLRGIGYGSSFPGLESPTTLLIDEVYSPSPAASLFSLNSIEQIEVLKGPQGTLFGRNAVAGAINILTRNPTQTRRLDADLEYGNYETVTGRFYGNMPISDTVAANVSLYYKDQGEGWGFNSFTGKDWRKGHSFDSRAKLRFTPDDETSFLLTAWYNKMDGDYPATSIRPGTIGVGGLNTLGFFDGRAQDQQSTSEQYGVSGRFEHDLGWASIVDIASYQHLDAYFRSDNDGTAADPALGTGGLLSVLDWSDRTITNELRLVSPNDGLVTWVGGLYYLNEVTDPVNLTSSTSTAPLVSSKQETESVAPFGEATIKLRPDTRLTLGARYNYDKRTFSAASLAASRETTFEEVTWRVSLSHDLTDNILIYASANRGYHAGSYSLSSPTAPVLNPELLDAYELGFKSQWFDNKFRLNIAPFYYDYSNVIIRSSPATGGAVLSNAAAAEVKGLDIDFQIVASSSLSIFGGVEFLDAKFTDWPGAAVTVHNTTGPLAGTNSTVQLVNGAGFKLTNAPDFSGNLGARYLYQISAGELAFNAAYSYRSKIFWDPGNRLTEKPVGLVNGSVVFTPTNGNWNIGVFGQNLTDEHYNAQYTDTASGDIGPPAAPRTYGVRVGVKF